MLGPAKALPGKSSHLIQRFLAILFSSHYILFLGHSLHASEYPSHMGFRHILEQHDVAIGVIRDIKQDKNGFIWIGGDGALLRFDGYELRNMSGPNDKGESIHGIYEIFTDNGPDLWVATTNGLARFNLDTNTLVMYDSSDSSPLKLSSRFTTSVTKSPTGEILTATPNGLNILSLTENKVTVFGGPNSPHPMLAHNHVWTSYTDSKNYVWVGTAQGATRINWKTKETKNFRLDNHKEYLNNDEVRCFLEDSDGFVWLCTMNGINLYNPHTAELSRLGHSDADPYSIGSNQIWQIHQDRKGMIWIGTDHGGLNLYDKKNKRFKRFKHRPSKHDSLSTNTVRSIFEDRSGDLWLGLYPTGVNFYDRSSSGIEQHTKQASDRYSLSHNFVFDVVEDEQNNFWIATDGGGLNYFNRETGVYEHFQHSPNDPNSLSGNAVIALELDSNNQLWIGTWGAGLNLMDIASKEITRIPINDNGSGTSAMHIWDILETQDGMIWLATQGAGLNSYNPENQQFHYFPPNHPHEPQSLSNDTVWSLLEDSQNNLWVGTNGGLNLMDRRNANFRGFFRNDDIPGTLSSNNIQAMHEDKAGNLWMGTRHGLNLYNPDTETFNVFRLGLADELIYSISEDEKGEIWLGTSNGISKFSPTSKTFTNYNKNDSWQSGAIRVAKKISTKEIFLGGAKGFTFVSPSRLTANKEIPPIALTDFKIFTQSLLKIDPENLLHASLNNTDKIILNHTHTMFSIEFAALNFRAPQKNQYAYKLEGFDSEWRNINNRRTAIYTNLDAGTYTFRVKGSNNDNVWNNIGHSLTIVQRPPPWKTWWAYCCYLACIFALLYWFIHQKTEKLKFEKTLQEKTNLKLVKLDKMKSDFMANTSHELLTPLNGIVGLSEFLEEALDGVNNELHDKASMIVASGRRLSSLVYDIIDFSNISENKLALQLSPQSVYHSVEQAFELMRPMLTGKDIRLNNEVKDQTLCALADPNRLQHILGNLISNAIKYSEKGDIYVSAKVDGNFINISIEDEGIGINPTDQKKIFGAFDQLEDSARRLHEGAGLGLALTKKLVELHGGEIHVKSQEGIGSCFTFSLNYYNKPLGVSQIIPKSQENTAGANDDSYEQAQTATTRPRQTNTASDSTAETKPLENPEDYTILIVDDDAINRMVLKGILKSGKFGIIEAESGPEALKLVEETPNIDLVILDVMMPKMTGFEVCEKLRETYPMYDLPVIFLTAKTSEDAMIDGMESGGNDFLVKPTSKSILLPKVESLIKLSAQLRSVVK